MSLITLSNQAFQSALNVLQLQVLAPAHPGEDLKWSASLQELYDKRRHHPRDCGVAAPEKRGISPSLIHFSLGLSWKNCCRHTRSQ